MADRITSTIHQHVPGERDDVTVWREVCLSLDIDGARWLLVQLTPTVWQVYAPSRARGWLREYGCAVPADGGGLRLDGERKRRHVDHDALCRVLAALVVPARECVAP